MRTILPIFALLIAVLGCGLFRNDSKVASNNEPASTSSPTAPVKAVDMPSLIGKSRDEIKKIVPAQPKRESDLFVEWDLPQGNLEVNYHKGKQSRISFIFTPVSFGSQTISGFDSADKLGDLVGIDVHGKTPTSTVSDSFVTYEKLPLNGKPVKDVKFNIVSNRFTGVAINLE